MATRRCTRLACRPGRPLSERSVGRLAARCASVGPASLTVATTELSAGLTTSKVAPPRACTHVSIDVHARGVGCHDASLSALRRFAEAVRRLDPGRGPEDVLALELLEVPDTRHDVVALGGMARLRPLERRPHGAQRVALAIHRHPR